MNTVIFLTFCHAVVALLRCGATSSASKSKESRDLVDRVEELEGKTEEFLKKIVKNEKIYKGLKDDLKLLQRDFDATKAGIEELQTRVKRNTAAREDLNIKQDDKIIQRESLEEQHRGLILNDVHDSEVLKLLEMADKNEIVACLKDVEVDASLRFKEIDEDGSGYIDVQELSDAFYTCGMELPPYATRSIIRKYDINSDDKLDFEEFKKVDASLRFKEIDEDGSGYIDVQELSDAFYTCGMELPPYATRSIIRKYDINSDDKLDFEEFKKVK